MLHAEYVREQSSEENMLREEERTGIALNDITYKGYSKIICFKMLVGFQYSNIMRLRKVGMVTRKGKMKNTEKY
jgi:hypothetical protein